MFHRSSVHCAYVSPCQCSMVRLKGKVRHGGLGSGLGLNTMDPRASVRHGRLVLVLGLVTVD